MTVSLEDARRCFAEEIRELSDIQGDALIEGLARVPREAFLGPGPWQIVRPNTQLSMLAPASSPTYRTTPDADPRRLYHNVLVAIDPARNLNNGQPSANLAWIDALAPRVGERVVHVGAGVGYYTAVIAEAVGPTGAVLALEHDAGLAERARANLAPWRQVEVVHGDGASHDLGAFDACYINAGASRLVPRWLDGMSPRGRLHVPLTTDAPFQGGFMLLVERDGARYAARFTGGVSIFPCHGARDDESAAALASLFKSREFLKVTSLRRDPHERDATCALHGPGYCLSTAP
jgi:protein-L-isoaspartate(D-aspartate) O-methyltransferase